MTISDDGKGIEKEKFESIFEFGFGLGDSRVKMSSGLAVAYNIVKSHKGELNVESKVGEGSIFTVLLPINTYKE
ncbi:MAG: HAMP domain-containing histidine kinase [Candidatus Marinimicrobia bacterium]|nr:HAMP domain-containing histidine kinase [Candidatus Neomarinimicrobiota bacterium]